ncbi:unnamed protein product [Rotaria sordida]|uniref:N-terminal methionine N(alpha)-acetyltransferase NatE n=1 Tax=Rotaria sordida TaxID=392033 RepID=A0A813QAK1_9BILA|nr:unnamed protein product [Rotaria sordida]CAF0765477.1 unnamed protein product [Rotaria sordida]CAF0767992.1 unnamed protein product [Rotaria sordida]CAF0808883.1 unnamed protein product [Rotaria sordida]CAF0817218.1 unnamed protein product [Rotaria sordida]
MYGLFTETDKNDSNIQIYHNIKFPLDDIIDVLHPLFGTKYPFQEMIYTIYTVHHIFGAYDRQQGRCIACALINNVSNNSGLYIMLFGVQQSNQGHGIGTHLLEAIIQWAREKGYRFINLHVHIENYKAIGLYEKSGFRKSQYIPNYYAHLQINPPHAFRMDLPL